MIAALVQVHLDSEGQPASKDMHRFSSAQDLLEAWDRLKESKGWIYVVNCSKPSAPPTRTADSEPVPDGTCWCPYCADHRHFEYNGFIEQDQCNVCGITDRDYYVRKFNSCYYTKYLITRKGEAKKGDRSE